ncbi:MAG: YraN family protein [Spirochaetales bacterium]|nr:YraN family protein [Spirochaetales bacterium]
MESYLKGISGETAACEYLKQKEYVIIKRNFRCKYGEIDIIAKDKSEITFVEVKTWDALETYDLSYVINRKKLKRLSNASAIFLRDYKGKYSSIRFDVLLLKSDQTIYEYYTNIYMENGLP